MSSVRYDFEFADGGRWHQEVRLDTVPSALPADLPEWTRLEFHRCAHCPLDPAEHPHCPLAAAMVAPARAFAGIPSWTPVTARVTSPARVTIAETTLQRAVGSLIGLLSALSGCPHTRPLLPMAMSHLPFSTPEETLSRVTGMYLTGQHLRQRAGLPADWDMQGLLGIYRNLQIVNNGMAVRIRTASEHESTVNAIVLLDVLALDMRASLEEVGHSELEDMFAAYLPPQRPA